MQYQMDEDDQLVKDEDAQFEQDNELVEAEAAQDNEEEPKQSMVEGTLPSKEDTLGNSDFPPLSEVEKQPKLQDDDSIEEMNRKTSIGD